MRLADLLVQHLVDCYGIDTVFTVTGGGAMYLNDAFGKHDGVRYVALHHEQSVSMAAEAYARVGNRLGVCQVTTGPGGTNALSGCVGAWIDSGPLIFISGQVESFSLAAAGARQTGVQEVDMVNLAKPVTKATVRLDDPNMVLYELDRLIHIAQTGRPGPVWLDIPLDIQNHHFDETNNLPRFTPVKANIRYENLLKVRVKKFLKQFSESKRPLIMLGNGARGAEAQVMKLSRDYDIPIILGWNGKDLLAHSDPLYLGTAGQFGNREANLATAYADLIIGIGYRFSIPQIGYDPSAYAPQSTIVSVDIDPAELTKYSGFIDIGIQASATEFMAELNALLETAPPLRPFTRWQKQVSGLKKYQFDTGPRHSSIIDSFDFTDALSAVLPAMSTVITDMGTSFTCTHQQLKVNRGIRLMTSAGLAAMGFGLPGALGASLTPGQRTVTLITGDGGIMFNLQELQSIVTLNSPIKVIIYENDGYLTMKLMQEGRFKRYVASNKNTGIGCPDFVKVAQAFGIEAKSITRPDEIKSALTWLYADSRPAVLVVHTDPMQPLTPRVQTMSTPEGKLIPGTLDNMFPFLPEGIKASLHDHFSD
jgi:acetolactate synthase-1/2/3 large subunit